MNEPNIKFADIIKFSKGLPHQVEFGDRIDKILEEKGRITNEEINELISIWRSPAANPLTVENIISEVKGYQLSQETLSRCMAQWATLDQLADINACIYRYEINKTKARLCMFLAQIGHESSGLYYTREIDDGWYIPENFGLEAIAGADGGYKYRGAGYIQLSMPENYLAFAEDVGDPEIYSQGCPYVGDRYPAMSAGFWWKANGMNICIDNGENMYQISGRVNTGNPDTAANGMADRLEYYYRCVEVIPEF